MCSLCTNLCSPVEKRSKEGIQFIQSKTTLSLLHQAPYRAVSSKKKIIFVRASDTLMTCFWAFSRACLKKKKKSKKEKTLMTALLHAMPSTLWRWQWIPQVWYIQWLVRYVEGISLEYRSVSLVCATCRITKFFIFGFDCTQFTYST